MTLSKTDWALAAAITLAGGPAAAQFKSPDDAIEYRQGALAVMGRHFSRIGAMASGKTPYDATAAQADAELVATLAKLPWSAFVDGSASGDTSARPEVWSQSGKFKAATQKFLDATVRLAAAARTGKPDALKTAFDVTADTCRACHDDFRKKH